MPKTLKTWKGPKADEYRRRMKRNYYGKTAYAENHKQPWTLREEEIILSKKFFGHSATDMQISHIIGRSVAAIQSHRTKLNKRCEHATD